MILEMGTLTRTPIFFPMTFLSFFKKFFDSYKKSVYCLNNYCYIFAIYLLYLLYIFIIYLLYLLYLLYLYTYYTYYPYYT